MAKKLKNLQSKTLTYDDITKLSASRRLQLLSSKDYGEKALRALTAEEYARLFPTEYLRTQATSLSRSSGAMDNNTAARLNADTNRTRGGGGGASPSARGGGSTAPSSKPVPAWMKSLDKVEPGSSDPSAAARLSTEQQSLLDDLKKGKISADDPRVEFLKKLSPDKLEAAGIKSNKDANGNIQSFESAPTKASQMTDEQIAATMRSSGNAADVGRETVSGIIQRGEVYAQHRFKPSAFGMYNKGEGHNYRGGVEDFENMSLKEVMRRQNLPKTHPDKLFATGMYQVIPQTMQAAVRGLGLDPETAKYNAQTQHKIGAWLMEHKRKNLGAYITGKSENIKAAQNDFALEWASMPLATDMTVQGKYRRAGSSAYGGPNKAHLSLEQTSKALFEAREKYKQNIARGMSHQEAFQSAVSGITPGQQQTNITPESIKKQREQLEGREQQQRGTSLAEAAGRPDISKFNLGEDFAKTYEKLPVGQAQRVAAAIEKLNSQPEGIENFKKAFAAKPLETIKTTGAPGATPDDFYKDLFNTATASARSGGYRNIEVGSTTAGSRGNGFQGLCGVGTRSIAGSLIRDDYFKRGLGGNANTLSQGNTYLQNSGFYKPGRGVDPRQLNDKDYLNSLPIGTVISAAGGGKGRGHVQIKVGPNKWVSDADQGNRVLTNNYHTFVAHLPNAKGIQKMDQDHLARDPGSMQYMQNEGIPFTPPTPRQIDSALPPGSGQLTEEQKQKLKEQATQAQQQQTNQQQQQRPRGALLAVGTNDYSSEESAYNGIIRSANALRSQGRDVVLVAPARLVNGQPHAYNAAKRASQQLGIRMVEPEAFGTGSDHYHMTSGAARRLREQFPNHEAIGDSNAVRLGAREGETGITGASGNAIANRIEQQAQQQRQNRETSNNQQAAPVAQPTAPTAPVAQPTAPAAPVAQPTAPAAPTPIARTTEEMIKASPVQGFAQGGDRSVRHTGQIEAKPIGGLRGDNAVVVDENQKPMFTMNTDKESASYDPNTGKVKVRPVDKNNASDINRDISENDQTSMDNTQQQQKTQENGGGMQSASSSRPDYAQDIMDSTSTPIHCPSFSRAVAAVNFQKEGNHFDWGSKNFA